MIPFLTSFVTTLVLVVSVAWMIVIIGMPGVEDV
jgi:hypothetical protein